MGFGQYYGQYESQQTIDHSYTGMLVGDTHYSQVFGPGAEGFVAGEPSQGQPAGETSQGQPAGETSQGQSAGETSQGQSEDEPEGELSQDEIDHTPLAERMRRVSQRVRRPMVPYTPSSP